MGLLMSPDETFCMISKKTRKKLEKTRLDNLFALFHKLAVFTLGKIRDVSKS